MIYTSANKFGIFGSTFFWVKWVCCCVFFQDKLGSTFLCVDYFILLYFISFQEQFGFNFLWCVILCISRPIFHIQIRTQRISILSQIDHHGNEYHHLGTMTIHLSYSLDEVPPKFNFYFFAMSQFDWPITQKYWKLWRLPNIEGSILKYRVPLPWDPDAWIALPFFWSWSWSAQSCDTLNFKHDTWQMLSSSLGMLNINRWNYVVDMGDFYQIWTLI